MSRINSVQQTVHLENEKLILIELSNYPKIPTPLEAMKRLEDIERVKEKLIEKYKTIEVFISRKGAFRQIIKIEK